ncbi:MAG: hypothetical protein ACK5LC_07750 [Coprobacillaceae bacterium]
MKKILATAIVLCMLLLTGCDAINDMLGNGFDYASFSSAVSDPSGTTAGDYDGDTITFTAFVASEESFVMESDDADINGDSYIIVYIARNVNNFILLNLQDVKDVPAYGSIVTVEGKVDGYIYSTDEDGKQEALNIIAKSIENAPESDVKVNNSDTYTATDGDYKVTFKALQAAQGTFDITYAILYYDYEAIEKSIFSTIDELYVYQGDTLLDSNMFTTSFDEGIIDSSATATNTSLNAGEKAYVYCTYSGLIDTTTPLTLEAYDDDFNLIYEYTINFQ